MTLEEMKAVDLRTVSRDDLVDIHDVRIDESIKKAVKTFYIKSTFKT